MYNKEGKEKVNILANRNIRGNIKNEDTVLGDDLVIQQRKNMK